jgi:hypothetical protein
MRILRSGLGVAGNDGWCVTWAWGGGSKHVGWRPLDLLHRSHAIISAPERQPHVLVPSCAAPLLSHEEWHNTHHASTGPIQSQCQSLPSAGK